MDLFLIISLDIASALKNLDKELFILIHSKASVPSFDWFFKAMRNALTWVPLYALILYWILRSNRSNAWQFILLTLITFAITDHTSAAIMKPYLQRLRPCFDPELERYVRELVTCGGKFGMPSTHASNHFGLASFWFFSIRWMNRRSWYLLWIWAFVIGYSQVYVGKHYPGDILVGALLGTIVGLSLALVFRRWKLSPHTITAS